MDSVLRTVLNGTGLTYSMERDIVTISKAEQQGDKRSATGIVSDEEGYPLPGVNVVISDLQRFAITDNNGKYSIEIPLNTPCTITFSYIGMSTQQVMVHSGRNDVRKNITLKVIQNWTRWLLLVSILVRRKVLPDQLLQFRARI